MSLLAVFLQFVFFAILTWVVFHCDISSFQLWFTTVRVYFVCEFHQFCLAFHRIFSGRSPSCIRLPINSLCHWKERSRVNADLNSAPLISFYKVAGCLILHLRSRWASGKELPKEGSQCTFEDRRAEWSCGKGVWIP